MFLWPLVAGGIICYGGPCGWWVFFFLSVVPFGLGHFLPWLLWLVGSFLQWPVWAVEPFLPWPHVADGVTFTVALWVVGSFLLWPPCLLVIFTDSIPRLHLETDSNTGDVRASKMLWFCKGRTFLFLKAHQNAHFGTPHLRLRPLAPRTDRRCCLSRKGSASRLWCGATFCSSGAASLSCITTSEGRGKGRGRCLDFTCFLLRS